MSDEQIRAVVTVIDAIRTQDGAGVVLYRSLGQAPGLRLDPFLMLDEFGSERPDEYIAGFPPHPHRGFQTVTYMLEGHMLHEDHLGHRGHLRSGGVQWMNAGRGIIHSEMPQQEEGRMRGFQLWLNLPAKEKMSEPFYMDLEADAVPVYREASGLCLKAIAGRSSRGEGMVGPIEGISTMPIFWDLTVPANVVFRESLPVEHNVFVYVYEGALSLPMARQATRCVVRARQGAVLDVGDVIECQASERDTKFLLLAARPLHEPVVQHGPFVMNTEAQIREAIRDYREGRLALGSAESVRPSASDQKNST